MNTQSIKDSYAQILQEESGDEIILGGSTYSLADIFRAAKLRDFTQSEKDGNAGVVTPNPLIGEEIIGGYQVIIDGNTVEFNKESEDGPELPLMFKLVKIQ